MAHVQADGNDLFYHLGRTSAETWGVCEPEELANLEWFRVLGDTDLVEYTLGRLSTLDDERASGVAMKGIML